MADVVAHHEADKGEQCQLKLADVVAQPLPHRLFGHDLNYQHHAPANERRAKT